MSSFFCPILVGVHPLSQKCKRTFTIGAKNINEARDFVISFLQKKSIEEGEYFSMGKW